MNVNQTPEQKARDQIDNQLNACGWVIQNKCEINLSAGNGVAIREYLTKVGPADYVLFVDGKPVGIVEAKREEEGVHLTVHEDQAKYYADSKLKYLNNDPLPFVYESTGQLTRFTDYRDPLKEEKLANIIENRLIKENYRKTMLKPSGKKIGEVNDKWKVQVNVEIETEV